MSATTVTLEEVIAAAETRAASLVPETSGYLALAIGDATARLPLRLDPKHVTISSEGSVALARSKEVVAPTAAASTLRAVLAALLARSVGTMPGLRNAARPRVESERGIESVVEEIEAALIPVNRAAARRALARLARETARARDGGALRGLPLDLAVAPPSSPRAAEPTDSVRALAAPVVAVTTPEPETPCAPAAEAEEGFEVWLSGDTPAPVSAAPAPVEVASEPTPTQTAGVAVASADDLPPLDEAVTTLDVETAPVVDALPSVPPSSLDGNAATPSSVGAISERRTQPLGSLDVAPLAAAPREPVAPLRIAPPAPPAVHVETLPMRFEPGRVVLGPVALAPAEPLVVASAPPPDPADVAIEALPPEPERAAAEPSARESEPGSSPAVVAPETPTVPVRRPARARPWTPPTGPREAELGPVAASDADALIANFSRSSLTDGESLDGLRASLKSLADLPPTQAPPAVRRVDRLAADLRRREPTPPPPPVQSQALAPAPLPEPRRASRANLVFSLVLLGLGLAATGAIWAFYPEFFAGSTSALVQK